MEPQPADARDACPCCGDKASVWEYIESPNHPVTRVVMCDNDNGIGRRDSLMHSGCLLQMPPNDFYQPTGREAVRYWNEYARALTAVRRAKEQR